MLPARRLAGEYYKLDEAEVALVGRESGARVRLGDPISVRVAGVDPPRGRAELAPAGEVE
jgi:exoribonuclease R